ncbi:GNAT family N-acetyltransferase [Pedobacter faecalis]|uniref:GNAT family N-acetyltransferase n=1 Tax=Pedobacter faecalis TaxID=3041495 RepID=UPI00254A5B87|nr:GNAT family N-acetyltransferase [Pedobacter sp. ELA7]
MMILLRRAMEGDIDSIRDLAMRTWPSAYGEILSEEQISYMLDTMYSRAELLKQVRAGYVFLMAEEDGMDIGFAGYSGLPENATIYKLHKLYVLPQQHGKGVGKLLISEVCRLAAHAGAKTLQLNVNRHNKARGFYESLGFKIVEEVDINIGKGFFMNDFIMEKELTQ